MGKHIRKYNSQTRKKSGTKSIKKTKCDQSKERYVRVFPCNTIWVVHVITLCVRLCLVCKKENWWLLHPDEVFQSIEVAHSEVYGYGFRPYEYRRPQIGGALSAAEEQEVDLGMYSLRSFLYPKIFIMWFRILESLQIRINPFLAGKLLHALVSAHLPLAVYLFCYQFFRLSFKNRKALSDLCTLTSILTATSEHLLILGTHSLVNSFLSPIVMLCMAVLCWHISGNCDNSEKVNDDGICELPFKGNTSTNRVNTENGIKDRSGLECRKWPIKDEVCNSNKSTCNGHCLHQNKTAVMDLNSNLFLGNDMKDASGFPSDKSPGLPVPTSRHIGHHVNTCHSPRVNGLLNTDHQLPHVTRGLATNQSRLSSMLALKSAGFISGLACYMRLDLALFVTLTFLMISVIHKSSAIKLLQISVLFGAGFLLAVFVGGVDDRVCYGVWFISPFQWFSFNILHGRSSQLFGWQDSTKYIYDILLYSKATRILTVLIILVSGTSCLKYSQNKELNKRFHAITIILLLIFAIYSIQKHKEVRFLHNAIVLFVIVGSTAIFIATRMISQILIHVNIITYFVVIVSLFNVYANFPAVKDSTNRHWTYMQVTDSSYINECLEFVGSQNDSTGLFLDKSIHQTAGYSILHKNIPIISLVHYDFNEFNKLAAYTTPSVDYFGNQRNISVNILSRVSNFFTKENFKYLFKYLVENPEYNYFITQKSRSVGKIGFKQVFTSGDLKVVKRLSDPKTMEILNLHVKDIPIGSNATVLEYEGSWLLTFGLYHKAVERLKQAVLVDNSRVRPYQLLAIIYKKLNQLSAMQEILGECYKNNGYNICAELQPKVTLHQNYTLNLTV